MTEEGKGEDEGAEEKWRGGSRERDEGGREKRDWEMHTSHSRQLQDCRNKNFKA